MCIFFLDWRPFGASPYLLIAADNRDEFFARPTDAAGFWSDQPNVLAGRDAHSPSRGTWMGVSRTGQFSVLTNYRCRVEELRADVKSRGPLVSDFLRSRSSPLEYSRAVLAQGGDYNGFSLITASLVDAPQAVCCSNVGEGGATVLEGGSYGLSNQLLDSPWRKVVYGKKRFDDIVASYSSSSSSSSSGDLTAELLELLADSTRHHPDPNVPDTGFSDLEMQHLNCVCVPPIENFKGYGPYGTRTSTVVLVDRKGRVTFTERTMVEPIDHAHPLWQSNTFTFSINPSLPVQVNPCT